MRKRQQPAPIEYLRTEEQLPEYYDLRNGNLVEDIDFYASLFPDTGMRLLEIGCGTGRILRGLAERGFRSLVGADISPEMLDRARDHLHGQSVRLFQLDVGRRLSRKTQRELGQVDGVIMAFNVFHYIGPLARRRQCLKSCGLVLGTGGRAVIDSCIPHFFRQGIQTIREKLIRTLTDTQGQKVEFLISCKADFVHQTLTGRTTYRVYHPRTGELKCEYRAPTLAWFTKPGELTLLAEACGFRVEHRWGAYDRSTYHRRSERHIGVLQKV